MLHHAYQINNLKLILELGDSARHTLLELLDQFNGSHSGKYDRSGMNPAEKQKAKRGIAELKEKNIISKTSTPQSGFKINTDVIYAKNSKESIKAELVNSGKYDTHSEFFDLLIAIKEYFYDFYQTPAEFRVQGKLTQQLPSDFFNLTVQASYSATIRDNYGLSALDSPRETLLTKLSHLADVLDNQLQKKSPAVDKEANADIKSYFKETIWGDELLKRPITGKIEAQKIQQYTKNWINENYPELHFT